MLLFPSSHGEILGRSFATSAFTLACHLLMCLYELFREEGALYSSCISAAHIELLDTVVPGDTLGKNHGSGNEGGMKGKLVG